MVKMVVILCLLVDLVVVLGVVVDKDQLPLDLLLNQEQTHYMVPLTTEMQVERDLGLALHIVDLVEVVPVVPVEMLSPQALVELVVMEEHLLLHMDQQIRYLMQVVVVAVTLHMVVIMQVAHLVEVVLLVPEEGSTGGGGGGNPVGASTPNSGGSGIAVIRYQIATISTAKATGGAVSFAGGKTIHTFVNSGTFTVTSGPISADYLVIGGGGGGGTFDAGGGGAGALKYATGQTIADGPYSVTVGGGGSTGQLYPGSNSPGTQSQLALPSAVTSPGGGGGAPYQTDGGAGGSGGGGGGNPGRSVAAGSGDSGHPGGIDQASPSNGWGNDGAVGTPNTSTQPTHGGGGGGAAGAGDNGITSPYPTARVVPVVMAQDIVFLEPLDIMLVVVEEDLKVIQEEFHRQDQEDKVVEVTVDMDLLFLPINLMEMMQR